MNKFLFNITIALNSLRSEKQNAVIPVLCIVVTLFQPISLLGVGLNLHSYFTSYAPVNPERTCSLVVVYGLLNIAGFLNYSMDLNRKAYFIRKAAGARYKDLFQQLLFTYGLLSFLAILLTIAMMQLFQRELFYRTYMPVSVRPSIIFLAIPFVLLAVTIFTRFSLRRTLNDLKTHHI